MEKIKKNVFTFMDFDKHFDNAKIIYFGAPYDGTSSFRPGSRFAPTSIRELSYSIESYSPLLNKDLKTESSVLDAGDLNLFSVSKNKALKDIYDFTKKIILYKKIPFVIGGDHLISLPVVRALKEKYEDLNIIHLDAHLDLMDIYCGEKLSHATVIKRIWDIIGDNKIYHIGIRSGTKEEFMFSKKHTILCNNENIDIKNIIKSLYKKPVYITFDLDIFDPGLVSGVGTPEPGGLEFKTISNIINHFSLLNIVGADLVELSPSYDHDNISTIYACKIIRELILNIN